MVVTIHQPEHLPWLGFFHKLMQVDVYVMLDHVAFSKNYFHNRNRIRSANGTTWLTVPVKTRGLSGQPLNEVRIANRTEPRWRTRHWTSICQSYAKAPHFELLSGPLEALYEREWEGLTDLNEAAIHLLLAALEIRPKVIKSSALGLEERKGELVLEICRAVGADVYLSGVHGRDYLPLEAFARCGIEVRFQDFRHPVYRQRYLPFVPRMSAVDLLFNHGPESRAILRGAAASDHEAGSTHT